MEQKNKENKMKTPIKILHIDIDYQVVYMIIFDGVRIKTPLPLEIALSMLEDKKFDLIFFEPRNMAVFTPLTATDHLESIIDSFSRGSLGSPRPTSSPWDILKKDSPRIELTN